MSESVQPFDESGQKPLGRCADECFQPPAEISDLFSVQGLCFLQDVEKVACGKVNAEGLRRPSFGRPSRGGRFEEVEQSDLYGPSRKKLHALARHITWFILYSHTLTRGRASSVKLGRLYMRDHSSVLLAVHNTAYRIIHHPKDIKAVLACKVYHELAEKYNDSNVQLAASWVLRNK